MIRPYQGGDELGIVAVWNRAMPVDPVTQTVFTRRVLLDVNFDPAGLLVAVEAGEVVGALYAVVRSTPMYGVDLESDSGWVTFLCVDPRFRKRGIGRQLLDAATRYFVARQRKEVFFASYAPNYFLPGIDATAYPDGKRLLEAAGYQLHYSCVAMDRNLVGFTVPADVRDAQAAREREGYVFAPLTLPYVTQVIDFSTRVFSPDWGRAIREGIAQGLPLERVLIAVRAGVVEGFCMYGGYDGVAERFGPFGVGPSQQGTGLGKILLYRCLEVMRAEGLHTAWFLWTGEHSPAGSLYQRAGFSVTRRFDILKLSLSF